MRNKKPGQNQPYRFNTDPGHAIIRIMPYTLKELADLYEVDRRTFLKWLEPFCGLVGERIGRYYTVVQVEGIIRSLGVPRNVDEDEFE